MLKKLLFAVILSQSIFSSDIAYSDTPYDDPLVKSIIREFETYFPGIKVPKSGFINFQESPSVMVADSSTGKQRPSHGVCFPDWNNKKLNKIYLYASWWRTSTNQWQKRKVLMHEMGHCLLNLKHLKNPLGYSIMSQTLDTVNPDGSNWGYLMGELRTRWMIYRRTGVGGYKY